MKLAKRLALPHSTTYMNYVEVEVLILGWIYSVVCIPLANKHHGGCKILHPFLPHKTYLTSALL